MKTTRETKIPVEQATLADDQEEFSLVARGARVAEISASELESIGLLVGLPIPDRDTPVSRIAAELAEPIASLCERAEGLALFLDSREEIEARVQAARHSLASLRDFSADAESRGLMPGHPKFGLADNGRSPAMLLEAVAEVSSDLESSVRALARIVSAAEESFGKRTARTEGISAEIGRLVAPVQLATSSGAPPAYSTSSSGAISAGIESRPISSIEVARIVDSVDPFLHESLMIRSSFVPAGTDGTLVRAEAALEAIEGRKPKIWKSVKAGDEISRVAPIHSQTDIEVDLRGVSRLELGVPRGYSLEAVEVRDHDDRPIRGGLTAKLSIFGEVRFEPPENARTLLMRVEEGVGPELRRDVVDKLRQGVVPLPAPVSGGLAGALDASRRDSNLYDRAQLVAGAFKATEPIYTLDPLVSELIEAAGVNKLALLNGLNAGTCLTLSFQLANLLNAAGVPAIVDTGPYCTKGGDAYLDSPGHSVVRCFVPREVTFDPTLWTTSKASLDASRVPASQWRALIDTVAELDSAAAYELGRTLRTSMKVEQPGRESGNRETGHAIKDDLDDASVLRAERIMRSHRLGEEISAAWELSQSLGSLRPLETLWAGNVQRVTRACSDFAKPEDEAGRVLLSCAVAACNDRSFVPEERIRLVTEIAKSFGQLSGDHIDFSPALKALDPIMSGELECPPPVVHELCMDLAAPLRCGPTDASAANAWRQAAATYCRLLDLAGGPVHRRMREVVSAYGEAVEAAKIFPDIHAYAEAFGSRFRKMMLEASMQPADLYLRRDERGAIVPGPRESKDEWNAIVAAQPALAGAFDGSGRPSPALLRELKERAVALMAQEEIDTAVRFLTDLANELDAEAVDLSEHIETITEIARASLVPKSAIGCPAQDDLAKLIFELGISGRREDVFLMILHSFGGLDLEALESSWPQSSTEVSVMSFVDSLTHVALNGDALSMSAEYDGSFGREKRYVDARGWLLYLCHGDPDHFAPELQRLASMLDVDPERTRSSDEIGLAELLARSPALFDAMCNTILSHLGQSPRVMRDSMLDALMMTVPEGQYMLYALQRAIAVRFASLYEEGGRTARAASAARALIGSALERASEADPADGADISEALERARSDLGLPPDIHALPAGERLILLNAAHREWDHAIKRYGQTPKDEDRDVMELMGYSSTPYAALFMDERMASHTLYAPGTSSASMDRDLAAKLELTHAELEGDCKLDDEQIAEAMRKAFSAIPAAHRRSGWSSMLSAVDSRGSKPFPSRTDDFRGYRQYQPGDDSRLIDSRAYGRTDKLLVREFNAGGPKEAEQIRLRVDAEALASNREDAGPNIGLIHRFVAEAVAAKRPISLEVSHRGSTICDMSNGSIVADFLTPKPSGALPGQKLFGSLWQIGVTVVHHSRIYDRALSFEGTAMKGGETGRRTLDVYACHPKNVDATLKERGRVALLRNIGDPGRLD